LPSRCGCLTGNSAQHKLSNSDTSSFSLGGNPSHRPRRRQTRLHPRRHDRPRTHAAPRPAQDTMSSLLSNLLTNTTSRYTNLRRQLLSDENDGDTEDDSHISRVLRAYYTEKGRPYPQWLPPDPRAPTPTATTAPQFASSLGRQQGQASPMGRGGGGLSDLWDNNPAPQQQAQEPLSLRRGAGGRGAAGGRPMQGRQGMGNSLSPEPQMQGRPLPSQRAGSYQTAQPGRPSAEPSPPPSAGAGTTAQERLKARLWGAGRSTSPAPGASSGAPARGSYERPSGRPPYPDERSYSGGSTGSGGRQQGSSDYDPYAAGNYNNNAGGQRAPPGGGRVGLPSGPRMR
jgi:hypothetical protein